MIPALIYNNRISWQKSNFLKKLQRINSGDSGGQIFINFWRCEMVHKTTTRYTYNLTFKAAKFDQSNNNRKWWRWVDFQASKVVLWDELLVSELCHHETNKVISPFFSQWDKLKNKWGSVGIIRGLWTKSPGVLKLSSTTSTTHYWEKMGYKIQ